MSLSRGASGGTARGVSLVECVLAAGLLVVVGVSILGLSHATGRDAHSLRASLLMGQLALDLLDRLAAGEARGLLPRAATATWQAPFLFTRTLAAQEWEALVPAAAVEVIGSMSLSVSVEIEPVDLAAVTPGQPVRLWRVRCIVSYEDPARGSRQVRTETIADAV